MFINDSPKALQENENRVALFKLVLENAVHEIEMVSEQTLASMQLRDIKLRIQYVGHYKWSTCFTLL